MRKLFLIEDDPILVRMYEIIFKLNNFSVDFATKGEEALEKLKSMEEKPTIILLDLLMPKMSGLEILKKIKEESALKDIPLIILTNLAVKEDIEKGLELGAISSVMKSEHLPKELVKIVEDTLEKLSKK